RFGDPRPRTHPGRGGRPPRTGADPLGHGSGPADRRGRGAEAGPPRRGDGAAGGGAGRMGSVTTDRPRGGLAALCLAGRVWWGRLGEGTGPQAGDRTEWGR